MGRNQWQSEDFPALTERIIIVLLHACRAILRAQLLYLTIRLPVIHTESLLARSVLSS